MNTHHTEPPVPAWRLERYRLGELAPDDMDAIRRRAAVDGVLQDRLAAIEQSDRELSARYPAPVMLAAIRARQEERGPRRRGRAAWTWAVPAAIAATLLVVVSQPGVVRSPSPAASDPVVVKGSRSALAVFRRVEGGSSRLSPGARVQRGDEIRLGYRSGGVGFGAIVSVDKLGAVTQHLPASGQRAVALGAGDLVLLESAYELDAAPGWERFYFVTSSVPFELEPVRRAARAVAGLGSEDRVPALDLPPSLEQYSFSLSKAR